MTTEDSSVNCIHPVIYNGMCSECGAFVEPDHRYHKTRDIYVLSSVIDEEDNGQFESFLTSRKQLALVVDLDKTVIDTIRVNNEEEAKRVIALDKEHEDDFILFTLSEMYLVRVRPFTAEFLKAISPYYFMQVYTLSQKAYALKILEKIDPSGEFFNERLLSREDGDPNKKSMSNFFLSGQHMAVVIDDTSDVWKNADDKVYKGLVQLEGFHYFTRTKEINAHAWNDDTLKVMTEVLIKIHHDFYNIPYESAFTNLEDQLNSNQLNSNQNQAKIAETVAIPIDRIKRAVFDGCYIYFCKFWNPEDTNQTNYYIRKVEEFGGHVLTEFLPYCTHVVSSDPTHEVVKQAEEYKGIFIVNYSWFFRSFYRFQRQSELAGRFEVKNGIESASLKTNGEKIRTEPPAEETGDETDDILTLLDGIGEEEEEQNADSEDIDFLFASNHEEEEEEAQMNNQ